MNQCRHVAVNDSTFRRNPRRDFYWKLPNDVVDLGLLGAVSGKLFVVYTVLRTFVWRTDDCKYPERSEQFARGRLVAYLKPRQLAALAGVKDAEPHTIELTDLGWVKSLDYDYPNGAYWLGNKSSADDDVGVLFFDQALLGLRAKLGDYWERGRSPGAQVGRVRTLLERVRKANIDGKPNPLHVAAAQHESKQPHGRRVFVYLESRRSLCPGRD